MKCISCGAEALYGTATDVTDMENSLVIVRNVPCHKCSECSEIIYTADVVTYLESVTETAKTALNEVAIMDYNSRVA
jgi:YgiT-type zinc finger domain-containing protein